MTTPTIIAVDVDDTLTQTAYHTFVLAKKVFDHPLSVDELMFEYSQPGEVPEWKNSEVDAWLEKHLGNVEYMASVPASTEAQSVVHHLAATFSIACYITSRQHYMQEMTEHWLAEHGFPTAPVVTRGVEVTQKTWKLAELRQRFSEPVFLIDDNLGHMTDEQLANFNGKLLWFNPLGQEIHNTIAQNFTSWLEIEQYFYSLS